MPKEKGHAELVSASLGRTLKQSDRNNASGRVQSDGNPVMPNGKTVVPNEKAVMPNLSAN